MEGQTLFFRFGVALVIGILVGLAYSLFLYLSQHSQSEEDVYLENPFDLGMAI